MRQLSRLRFCAFPRRVLFRSFSYPPHEVVGLPALSPTMDHGNLAKWRLKEGDRINSGDVICEVETDKAVVDFEAQDDMFLAKILVPEGTEQISVGQPIMVTCEEEEDVAKFADFKVEEKEVAAENVDVPQKESSSDDAQYSLPSSPQKIPENVQPQSTQNADEMHLESQKAETSPPRTPVQETKQPPKEGFTQSPFPQSIENWGLGVKKSPLAFSLAKKQQEYLEKYGFTGRFPITSQHN
uniref:Dihydrolipoyllysineresidue acetyltransferase component of pyruvate dehydrogenase complex putative n=1 Tax=Albugo laibachii Nc14 TaxID=890382 RepID=F0WT72_9STRA|nr:dihydrolipoyllysineresidue acetyltransferase component of pyruvate dehydrogenase complex putative [Albugo laibachii Nc14]|eukprot:CCA24560.1 dihydrolipoyllysineresidue acetyltransferase component of pyruvate dehydrogenase complex putative [Albugo laibachii Nc14]